MRTLEKAHAGKARQAPTDPYPHQLTQNVTTPNLGPLTCHSKADLVTQSHGKEGAVFLARCWSSKSLNSLGAGGGGGKQSIFKDEVRAGHPRAQDPLVRLL